jgi:tyrosine-protein phosphatase YwqE
LTWISNIFNKDKGNSVADYSSVAVDIHSHLIPGIDDGSRSLEESLLYISGLKELGFKKLITTPHISENYFKNSNEDVLTGFKTLKSAIEENNIEIELEVAAEYQIDEEFEKKMNAGTLLTFGDKYLLVELSYFLPFPNLNSILYELNIAGYNIILAHPERYEYWQGDIAKYDDLKSRDVFFQLNTISLNRFFGDKPKKTAEMLIDNNLIDFIGSDLHSIKYLESLKTSLNEKYFNKLLSSGNIKNHKLL